MAITLKSKKQIEMLRQSGRIVAETFEMLRAHVKPGITTEELDRLAEEFIRKQGAEPVYKGYGATRGNRERKEKPRKPFPASICVAINDVICHGIPSKKQRLAEGDIIGIDIGARYKGWVGDSCVTFPVGTIAPETQRLLEVTERCLYLGIEQSRAGKRFGDIGHAIESFVKAQGFSVVQEYTGHGVGRNLHEDPQILHHGKPRKGKRVMVGMVFTIEPMVNAGKCETQLERDGWTVKTKDGSLSAQFEHQLAITEDGPVILTL